MNSYKVRTARIEDLETLLNFEQEIVKAERPFDPTIQKGAISYYDIRELILSPDAEVVVVEYNGDVVASGHARITAYDAIPIPSPGRYQGSISQHEFHIF